MSMSKHQFEFTRRVVDPKPEIPGSLQTGHRRGESSKADGFAVAGLKLPD